MARIKKSSFLYEPKASTRVVLSSKIPMKYSTAGVDVDVPVVVREDLGVMMVYYTVNSGEPSIALDNSDPLNVKLSVVGGDVRLVKAIASFTLPSGLTTADVRYTFEGMYDNIEDSIPTVHKILWNSDTPDLDTSPNAYDVDNSPAIWIGNYTNIAISIQFTDIVQDMKFIFKW